MSGGVVRYTDLLAPTFRPVSRDIARRGHSEYWLMGGRGSTKSSFVSAEIAKGIITHPEANAIIYRKVAATLRDSVYDQMIKSIGRMGLSRFFECRLSPLEIRYRPTGQRIMFRGADDPGKSKSITLQKGYFGYLWFEELAEFSGIEDVRTIKASIIRGGRDEITFYSYNPPMSAQNWVNKEAIVPRDGRLTHASSYLDVPPEWLGAGFVAEAEALKATNERAYRHMYLGEVTGTGGQVFDNLKLGPVTDELLDGFGTFVNGLDFGFAADPDAFTRWAYDAKKRRLAAVSEFYGVGNNIDTLAERTEAAAMGGIVRCDSADPRMIAELKRRGVRAVGVKKGPGSVEHGMRWLQSLGEIMIDPERTPNIAREFAAYEYQRDRSGGFLSEYPDKDNHAIDSARYALADIIAARKLQTADKGRFGL